MGALLVPHPLDLMTSTGSVDPSVSVYGAVAEALPKLAALAHLLTWPELDPISTTANLTVPDLPGKPAIIALHPNVPLTDRWYAVKLDTLPSGVSVPEYSMTRKLADGSILSRFRTGSEPIIAWVELCRKGGVQSGAIVYSERVNPGSSPESILALDGTDCSYVRRPVTGVPDKIVDTSVNSLQFACASQRDIGLRALAGAIGLSSSTVVPPAAFSLAWSAMEPMGQDCRRLVAR